MIYWIFPIVIFVAKVCGVVVPSFITALAIISLIAACYITIKDAIDNYRMKRILNALEKRLKVEERNKNDN